MMLKTKITNCLKKFIKELIPIEIFIPENEKFGHYSTNVALRLAKILKKNPMEIANQINSKFEIRNSKFLDKVEVAPPGFINFWISQKALNNELKEILKLKENYGSSKIGKGKNIIIDYSAPNVAKPMMVGHLRSTIIGQALADILRFQGYRVFGDNHLGDWGTQFGVLIVAYKKWGKKREFEKHPVDYLVKLYVRFHKASEKYKDLIVEAREETKKLQAGDRQNLKLWKLFVKESLANFGKIYKRLGVKFDFVLGESFYQPLLESVVREALEKGVAKMDDAAVKIFYNGSIDSPLPPLVIQKSDGSFLYSTTDLTAVKYRMKKWQPKKILYVVANEQTLHFEQIFDAARRLKYIKNGVLKHIKFGMVLGETGKKMSTRRGQFIKLEELLDKAAAKAAKINRKVAEEVAIGAVKYRTLFHERKSDIVFNWNEMLNLKGNSGSYLQYTYARLKSVLRKASGIPKKPDFLLLKTEVEKNIVRHLIYFPDIISRAAERYETNVITDYLFKLANSLNYFYESEPILKAEKPLRENRLNLILAATIVLKNGLGLLGIKTPEKM